MNRVRLYAYKARQEMKWPDTTSGMEESLIVIAFESYLIMLRIAYAVYYTVPT